MAVEVLAPRDVQTTLNYYAPLDDQPAYNYFKPPPGVKKTNVGEDTRPVVVHDARGKGDVLTLDMCGFQFVHCPSVFAEKDFLDEDKVKKVYYAEIEEILKKHAGAKRVFIFNHIIRWSTPDHGPIRGPIHHVHVDQTHSAVIQRVKEYLGDDAERLLKGRYGIINVWRPIANPVAHNPLAVADYHSVDCDHDLVTTHHVDPHREGYLFNVKYNPKHKWYYLSDQTPDEAVMFKCFDSDVDKASFAPHTAFYDSTSSVDAPQRQSIDIRALVFDTE